MKKLQAGYRESSNFSAARYHAARMFGAFLVVTLSLFHGPAFGATGDSPDSSAAIYLMPEVTVSAPRPVTSIGGAAAVTVQVDSLTLPPAATVEEVLRELPLLHVRTNSRGEAEVSARGSESRQVAVLVDGIPITLAWDARADVSVIPSDAMQKVVYVRGLSSMLYGPNVLGGVIDLSIGQGSDAPTSADTRVTVGGDNVESFGATISTAIPLEKPGGKWLFRGGLGYRNTPGDPLAEDIEEPVETDDNLRLNTDSNHVDGFLALRYRANGGSWLAFSGSSFDVERGVAAQLGVPDDDARLWRYPSVARTLAVLSGGTGSGKSPLGGQGGVQLSLGYDKGHTNIDSYTSRAYDETDGFENGRDAVYSARMTAEQTLGERNTLRGAVTYADIHHDEIIPDGTFEYRQRLWSLGLEDNWRLIDSGKTVKALLLSLGGAWDGAETPEAGGREPQEPLSEWGGRLGLSMVTGHGETVFHAGVSRRGRFPALRELYSGALNRFVPNPELEPEKLVTLEGGVTNNLGNGELQAVLFRNWLQDAVVRITLPDRRFIRVNRDELNSTGIELVASQNVGAVGLAGSFTLQSVELTDTDSGEIGQPENLPEAFGELSARFPLPLRVVGAAAVGYTGEQFSIDPVTGEDALLSAEAVIGASLSRTFPLGVNWGGGTFSKLDARVSLDNAGDVAQYDSYGLPEPGRRVRFEIRLH